MKLTRYNPFFPHFPKGFGQMTDELFNRSLSDFVGSDFFITQPSVNVVENDNQFEMEVAAPGLVKEDFEIRIDDNHLVISAKKEQKEEVTGQRYTRREFNFTSFERSFKLPEMVEIDNINAKYENGVLTITLPKKDETKVKAIKTIDVK